MPTKHKTKKALKPHHHVLKVVWPHHRNDYRPHLIRPLGLMLVIGIAIGVYVSTYLPKSDPAPVVMGDQVNKTQDELLTYTNRERLNLKLPALQANDRLAEAAELKARDILERQYWAHNAPDGTTPWHWYRKVNYRYDYAGENLAKGFNDAGAVVDAWMNSKEHRDNMLSPFYEEVGFAAVSGELQGESTQIVVAMYGSRAGITKNEAKPSVLSAAEGDLSPIARFGVTLKSLSPAQLGSIVLLAIAAIVALLAHAYRKKLPKSVQKTWKRHHGLVTFISLSLLIVAMIALYGTGNL